MKFYSHIFIFIIIVVLTIFLQVQSQIKLLIIAVEVLLFVSVLAWASISINSQFYVKTICRSKKKNMVAITFDDGPDPKNTIQILNLLDDYNAKATFFVIGEKAEENSGLVKLIHDSGHLIANHSYSHSYFFPMKSSKKIKEEILNTQSIIENITGEQNKYFRPPFGVTNPLIAGALKNLYLTVVGWSIRSFDTTFDKSEKIINRIKKRLKGGEILLLHDTGDNIIPILKNILEELNKMKLKVVRVDELID
jgi:peptidoglycan-N-acetylglucosamine deacetylase